MMVSSLSTDELRRYSRHLLLPEIGEAGQRRLKGARVLCIGAGGLGSPAALYLAAAGVGTLGLVDFDVVDFSNLQRQIIHSTPDVGRSKLASARAKIEALNPDVRVETYETAITAANARELLAPWDVVVDGTDNFAARYLVNDACVLLGKPNAWGSIFRFEGQASVFAAPGGPCYRCLHPEPPPPGLVPSCAEGGVLGVLPGVIGTIQATEAIKLVAGIGEPLIGRFLIYDALRMRFRELKLPRDPDCPICGTHPRIRELREYEGYCTTTPARGPGAGADQGEAAMTVEELEASVAGGTVPVLLDVREPVEAAICRLPASILIPLGELPRRLDELDPSVPMVVYCKSGGRSARAAALLRERGFANVRNLTGGILAWIDRIDPSLPRY
ncbi:MAG TPA: molybdopterin-synthase adenylyltransferase MoeB [Vicinamibacterales bacterium]|nr:molybdopterin-synthase adenylyltransferase MoeB [Vicinamibacterales bacterium]